MAAAVPHCCNGNGNCLTVQAIGQIWTRLKLYHSYLLDLEVQ